MEVLISKGGKERTANGKRHFQSAEASGEGEQSWIQGKAKRRMAGSWKMLLGPYSASGIYSRNEPAPEPRSDKTEPGTGPGWGFC